MATRSNNLSFANRSVRWVTASAVAFVAAGVVAVPTSFAAGTTTAPAPVVVPATGGSAAGVPLTDGSMYNVVDQINARSMWTKGYTGKGVNVALIDTGVAPVAALSGADKVVATVDLSTEANTPGAQFLDTFGHGTHMAGIIAGRDPGADPKLAATHPEWFMGVAPDAGLVSVKVGDNTGAVDVTQVIAGIDWVVENASALNIRVINLSYGTDSTLPYTVDPLDAAVERAWKAGIVVVAAVGNDGRSARHLLAPANDPYVVAVAAAESKNGSSSSKRWKVPTWANSGNGQRDPDVSAPGASIVSLRDPGSRVDTEHPEGYVSTSLFKGSGSSQATAVVSGLVALLLSAKPSMTPDQIKKTLSESALHDVISPQNARFSGFGLVRADLTKLADLAQSDKRWQNWPASNGSGNLDAVRNGSYVTVNGQVISGNITVTGAPWSTSPWVGPTWSEGTWNGSMFVDGSWRGAKWSGAKWSSGSWDGAKWSSGSWDGAKWSSGSWDGAKWSGAAWQ